MALKTKPPTWSHDDCRNLLEKGSIVPLPRAVYPPQSYWLKVIVASLLGMALAFMYGCYVP